MVRELIEKEITNEVMKQLNEALRSYEIKQRIRNKIAEVINEMLPPPPEKKP